MANGNNNAAPKAANNAAPKAATAPTTTAPAATAPAPTTAALAAIAATAIAAGAPVTVVKPLNSKGKQWVKNNPNGITLPQAKALIAPTSVINVLVGANPKRAGSASFARFALYTPGMLVSQYCALVGKAFGLPDLSWDSNRGFISINTTQAA